MNYHQFIKMIKISVKKIVDSNEIIKDLKVLSNIADIQLDEVGISKSSPKAKNPKQETFERKKEFNILNKFKSRLNIKNQSYSLKGEGIKNKK